MKSRSTHRFRKAFDELLDEILGTVSRVRILRELILHGHPLSASDLAERTSLSKPSAGEALALADPGDTGKPIMSSALRAVIAYGDALTIKHGGIKNAQDHNTLPRALRQALGQRAEKKQLRRLRRLLGQNDAIDYHHRDMDLAEARRFLKRARRIVRWAEEELMR